MPGHARDTFPVVTYGLDDPERDPGPFLLAQSVGPTVRIGRGTPGEALAALGAGAGAPVYHLHAEEAALAGLPEAGQRAAARAMVADLEAFRAGGGQLVWSRTDRPAGAVADELRAALADLASAVHLTSWEAVEDLQDTLSDPARLVVIPQGSYVPHYRTWPGPRARARLSLPDEAVVFLLFNGFGELSGAALEAAVAAFRALGDPGARLLVAQCGALGGAAGEGVIDAGASAARDEMLLPFAAADAVLVPEAAGLASRGALLAASAGRGVIGPDAAAIRALIGNGRSGALHEPGEADGLRRLMARALREGREVWADRGRAAGRAAAARDWGIVGRQWRDLYVALGGRPRYRLLETSEIVVA